jgi:hypothetical protein
MNIINQSVARTASGTAVEFVGEGGDKISVLLAGGDTLSSDTLAIDKAKAIMVQVATFGIEFDDTDAETFEPIVQHDNEASTSRTYSPID